jgi:hypothetical protein
MCLSLGQTGLNLSTNKFDLRLRELFFNSVDAAYNFAVESRDVEALGGVATLVAKCIDWEPSTNEPSMGFMSLNTETEGDEDE